MNAAAPEQAWVALGGNVGDVGTTFAEAVRAMDALPMTGVLRRSSVYRTPPWGDPGQPSFLNAAVELRTRLPPAALLAHLLDIERRFGRDRSAERRWGPRTLDLDLLMQGDRPVELPGLSLPHPRLHERAFVLVPLAEIAPDLVIPGRGRVADLLAAVDAGGIEAIP
ncbi:2-amino-4-hydroxy-6-hydroxymethyldihydropteridine diphosphokinase [Arenimonas fontis]|uniref:2-amino-4-hydroxy-6-hydroxymethyldihydropteridine pyrophosphokinase n=1 Tax=Arenimonas fontis TaxID=2608255 RepID=A0A5B2ZBQ9_9GAMM|nr:2-amino-4-hydroxy-6-hydroxymethyldihydropteridine diphosphokinase [Arenimonas fontis]KAA2285566.1 2-amino-4-hydroxy-6-hydroxymethyldihydropteridine diphosphokinase [Arenimonas fontis]